jgi:hypothetical protein
MGFYLMRNKSLKKNTKQRNLFFIFFILSTQQQIKFYGNFTILTFKLYTKEQGSC